MSHEKSLKKGITSLVRACSVRPTCLSTVECTLNQMKKGTEGIKKRIQDSERCRTEGGRKEGAVKEKEANFLSQLGRNSLQFGKVSRTRDDFRDTFQNVFITDLNCISSLLNWECLDSTGERLIMVLS